jgi:hypothetical protein
MSMQRFEPGAPDSQSADLTAANVAQLLPNSGSGRNEFVT